MRPDRALLVSIGLLLLAVAAFFMRKNGAASFPVGCIFRDLTSLHCAGCGMTRAAHATLNGDLAQAFRYNPLGMILLPIAVFGFGLEIIGWVRGSPLPFQLRPGKKTTWTLLIVILAFWVLRNVPAWPFSLLAPE